MTYIATADMTWLERFMHEAFAHRRVRGEWFNLSADEVAAFGVPASADTIDDLPSSVVAQRVLNEVDGFLWGERDDRAKVPVCDGITRVTFDAERMAALEAYCKAQQVRPKPIAVVYAAIEWFLHKEGLLTDEQVRPAFRTKK